jgi:hypothetical protein
VTIYPVGQIEPALDAVITVMRKLALELRGERPMPIHNNKST